MAVQQNKKSPSKRGMHRAHDFLTAPALAIEPTTGEVHLRHHVSPSGVPWQEGHEGQGRVIPPLEREGGAWHNAPAPLFFRVSFSIV